MNRYLTSLMIFAGVLCILTGLGAVTRDMIEALFMKLNAATRPPFGAGWALIALGSLTIHFAETRTLDR